MAKKTLSVAELVVNLTAKSAAFNSELKRAKGKTRDWAKETREHVNTAGKTFAALGGAAAASLAVIYKQASANIDALAKQSDRLGITTEDLGGLRHAAELTGVSQQKLDSSIERMVKRMGEAEMGLGASAAMLKKYDLATEDFFRKKPADQFNILADKIAGMNTQQEQAAFAAAVFGREGVSLINTAKLGSEGINQLKEEARELGLTLSRIDAAKVEAANDAMTRASAAFTGFSNSLTVEMAPLVTTFADMFTDATKGADGFRDEVIDGLEMITIGIGYLGNGIRGIEIAFKATQYVVSAFVSETIVSMDQLQNTVADTINLFAPDSMKIDVSNNALSILAKGAAERTQELKDELHSLAMEDLPTDKIEKFFDEIRAKSQAAAEKVANDAAKMGFGSGDGAENPAVTAQKDGHDILERNEKEHQERMAFLKSSEFRSHVDGTKTFFADLATLSQSGNKKLAAIGKLAAKINIGISTTEAAMHAYKWAAQWGGPPAGALAATAAVAAGLMRLQQLESGGIGGGGGLSGATTFDQGLPNNSITPPADSAGRGGEVVIQQSIEIKALDGASVQEVVNNNREMFVQPVLDHVAETGSL